MQSRTLDVTFGDRLVLLPVLFTGVLLLALFAFNPIAGVAAMLGLGIFALALRRSELAALAVIFAIYLNIPAVAARYHHVPKVIGASVGLLLLIPLLDRLIVRREEIIIDRVLLLMLLYLLAMLVSSMLARDLDLAARTIADYCFEGLVIYFLFSNVIRDLPTLYGAIGVLLLAGCLMGGLTIFQKATGTMDNSYGGFSPAGGVIGLGQSWGKPLLETRPNGPVGEQNRFAQILVVLVPLAALIHLRGRNRITRLAAAGAGILIVGGMVLTYSRGALLGLTLVFGLMVLSGYVRPIYVLPLGGLVVLAFLFSGPGLASRLKTFEQVPDLISGKSTSGQAPDESMRRRLAENLAALEVFADYPLFGVGPAHFARYYSTPYVTRIGLAAQSKGFFAHNLYLEIAANTGAFGLASFLAIAMVLLSGLWSLWRRLRWTDPDLAYVCGAFLFSCLAYFFTAVFLQLAFQRYFWLLVALASSTVRIVSNEVEKRRLEIDNNAEASSEN